MIDRSDRLVIDLFAGTGGATRAFRDAGYQVLTFELDPRHRPDVVCDVQQLPLPDNLRPFLLWASPPCTQYSRRGQPGLFPNEPEPDHTLYNAAREAIARLKPAWWVIENVKGAIPYFGSNYQSAGSFFLWSNLPPIYCPRSYCLKGISSQTRRRLKIPDRSKDPSVRAAIPYQLSRAVLESIESVIPF